MKGAFETMVLFFFGMIFTCLLVYAGINIAVYQQARCLEEMIIATIEHYHGYDEEVINLLTISESVCPSCSYSIYGSDQNQFSYRILVKYPILFPVLDLNLDAYLSTYVLIKKD